MEDEEIKRNFGHLQGQIWILQVQVTAYRLGLAVLARNHHDLPRLLVDFDGEVEAAIANYLTADIPEALVDRAREELEVMRGYLREVTEENQQQG
jgi:hypothetical protein